MLVTEEGFECDASAHLVVVTRARVSSLPVTSKFRGIETFKARLVPLAAGPGSDEKRAEKSINVLLQVQT